MMQRKIQNRPSRRLRGLTLVELLVTLAIIAIMILAFGTILSSTQNVVSTSQGMMRANAAAEAIGRTIRLDVQRVTKDGFLALRNGRLAMVTGGAFSSLRSGSIADDNMNIDSKASGFGDAQMVLYGLVENPARNDIARPILARKAYILDGETGVSNAEDIYNRNLPYFWSLSEAAMEDEILAFADALPDKIRIPAENNFESIDKLHMVVSDGIKDFSISYALANEFDGQGNILWKNDDRIWTHRDRNNWPVALRFRFKIVDPALPEEFTENQLVYEVICTVGR